MSKIASLKKKAADLEKKSPDKAVAAYAELLSEMEKYPEEMDIALFNRAGDLLVKQHNVAEAANYYEKAVDYYTEGGFVNNAIALCNKILRVSPGRSSVYYKLGRISAQKGFKADAKQNFLEYADRMQKAGRMDEAFRALGEFADLCPDQTDIRLMLSDQLNKAGKKAEAIEQLQILHEQFDSEGATAEAAATAERLRAIDPSVEPRAGTGGSHQAAKSDKSSDLIFLDLSDTPAAQSARKSLHAKRSTLGMKAIVEDPKPARSVTPPPIAAVPPPPPASAPPARQSVAKPAPPPIVEPEPVIEAPSNDDHGFVDSASLLGFETTSLGASDVDSDLGGGIEIDSTSLVDDTPAEEPAAEVPELIDPTFEAEADAADATRDDPAREASGDMLDFILPDGAEIGPTTTQESEFRLADDALIMPNASETLSPEAAAISDLPLVDDSVEAIEAVTVPTMSAAERPSSLLAAKSVEMLQAVVEGDPEDWASRRELAEALLEAGDREAGIRELELAMSGFERSGDLTTAMSVADEIVRVDPASVKHHQKRVEYAYRTNDRPQLVEAYLQLADALFRTGQVEKSRTIYQRVLELSPDDVRAQAALATIPEAEPEPPPKPADRKSTMAGKRASTTTLSAPPKPAPKHTPTSDAAFVNLGDWLREDDPPKDTRMVVAEEEPTGNEEADFADMLRKFKAGVAENVEDEDYQSHYDLGVAYKEMGLIDEAIAEFQKALRAPQNRVRTYEAIGQCFIEKGQNQIAATILARALTESEAGKGQSDEQLVGVLYLLGRASEALGRGDDALQYYQRVFVVDIQFHDVADRLNALENATR